MRKITYISLALIALFINSTVYAVEARISTTSIGQALKNTKSRDNFATLKNVKFDVKEKVYNITYVTKDGSVESVKISKVNGKEVK